MHFRRSTRQAAHAEVPGADAITILKRRYGCIYSSLTGPATQGVPHLLYSAIRHHSRLHLPQIDVLLLFHSFFSISGPFQCSSSISAWLLTFMRQRHAFHGNPTSWVTSAGRLVQRLPSPFQDPNAVKSTSLKDSSWEYHNVN